MKCSNCGFVNERRKKTTVHLSEAEFLQWWSMYPRKVSKFEALKAWNKIEAQAGLFERILEGLGRQRKSDQWQKGIIPNPSTWLHQMRWDDEVHSTGEIIRVKEPVDSEIQEKMRLAQEQAEARMEIEWAKRQAMKNAQIRDDLRSQRMQDSYGD